MDNMDNKKEGSRVFDEGTTYQSMIDLSSKIFGYLFLANGGGVIALLSLVGHFHQYVISVGCFLAFYWLSFASFVLGLVLAIASAVSAYFTQYHIFRHDKGSASFSLTIGLSALSIILFILGAIFGAIFVARLMG